MRITTLAMTAALLFAMAPTGCATVIGLDNGHPVSDDGGDALTTDGDAASDGASSSNDGAAAVCAPGTADCNGVPGDGCETMLDTTQHCGSCTVACLPTQDCKNGGCCSGANQVCVGNGDCCSGNCQDAKCKGGGPGG